MFSKHLPFYFICIQRQSNTQSLLFLSLKSAKSTTVVNFLVFQRQHLQKCHHAGNIFTLLFSTLAEGRLFRQNEKQAFRCLGRRQFLQSTIVVNFLVFLRKHLQKCNYAGNIFTLLFSTLAEGRLFRQNEKQEILCFIEWQFLQSTTVVNFLVFLRKHLQKCNYAGNIFTLLFSTLAEGRLFRQNEKQEFLCFVGRQFTTRKIRQNNR